MISQSLKRHLQGLKAPTSTFTFKTLLRYVCPKRPKYPSGGLLRDCEIFANFRLPSVEALVRAGVAGPGKVGQLLRLCSRGKLQLKINSLSPHLRCRDLAHLIHSLRGKICW